MSRIEKLDIVIRHKNGKVIAGIPQLSLYAKADDIHSAITALEQKRTAYFGDLAESGALDELEVREYAVPHASPRGHGGLGQFTLKALIIIGLIAGAFVLSAALLAPRIERIVENTEAKMQQYTKVGGAQFWEKLERELGRPPIRRMRYHPKRNENCCRRSTSSWSGGVHLWPKSRRCSPTFRDPPSPTVRRAASDGSEPTS